MEFGQGGLIGRGWALVRRIQRAQIPHHAAHAGYFIVLSVFPLLVLVLSILRYTELDAGDLMDLLDVYIPEALEDTLEKIVVQTYAYTGPAVISLSALGSLWSAGRGIYGILLGLNAVYEVREDRGWLYTRLVSSFYTVVFVLVLFLSLVLNVFGGDILGMLPLQRGPLWQFLSGIIDLRYVLMLLLQAVLFGAMYTVLPNRNNAFRAQLPGAVLARVGWQVFSALFSWYVENWAGYSNVYGSVYAVAMGMLWLYFCISIVFYGGCLNRYLSDSQNDPKEHEGDH